VIIVTSMLDCSYIDRARECGADSLWYKEADERDIMEVVERTIKGEEVFPDKTPDVRIGDALSCEFSATELKVLRLLVEGMTYKQMAEELNISSETVKAHVGNMLAKTGFSSKTKLAAVVTSKRLIVNGF